MLNTSPFFHSIKETSVSDQTYRFYVKPLTPEANEAIAASLNAQGEAAGTLEHQTIEYDGLPVEGVYEVRHAFLTELRRSVHKDSVRVYSQAGLGQIRVYALYRPPRPLRQSRAMRELMGRLMNQTKT